MSKLSYAIEMIANELRDQPHDQLGQYGAGYVAGLEWALERLEASA